MVDMDKFTQIPANMVFKTRNVKVDSVKNDNVNQKNNETNEQMQVVQSNLPNKKEDSENKQN